MAVVPPTLTLSSNLSKLSASEHAQLEMIGSLEDWPENYLAIALRRRCSVDPTTTKIPCITDTVTVRLCLFNINMTVNVGLKAKIRFRHERSSLGTIAGFYLAYKIENQKELLVEHTKTSFQEQDQVEELHLNVVSTNERARLVEVGTFCELTHLTQNSMPLLRIYNLTIKPDINEVGNWHISDIRVRQRGIDGDVEKRLTWAWAGDRTEWSDDLPWSSRGTGPFSRFVIFMDGKEIGDAYCQEFPLRRDDFDEIGQADAVNINIQGIMFGGGSITSSNVEIRKADLIVPEMYCSFG